LFEVEYTPTNFEKDYGEVYNDGGIYDYWKTHFGSYLTTYHSGPILKTTKNISKSDFMIMCKDLNENFKPGKYIFVPEKITEGGLEMKPTKQYDKKEFQAKLIRFCKDYQRKIEWPYIKNIEDWSNDNELVFLKDNKFGTVLKSFYAPCWKMDEIDEICHIKNEILRFIISPFCRCCHYIRPRMR